MRITNALLVLVLVWLTAVSALLLVPGLGDGSRVGWAWAKPQPREYLALRCADALAQRLQVQRGLTEPPPGPGVGSYPPIWWARENTERISRTVLYLESIENDVDAFCGPLAR